jgi:hypothetical protein
VFGCEAAQTIQFLNGPSISDLKISFHFRLFGAPGNLIVPCWTVEKQPEIFFVRIHAIVNDIT